MAPEEAGVLVVDEYIKCRQNTVAQYIATRSLLELFEGLDWAPGVQAGMRWWEQVGNDLAGSQEAAEVAKKGDER